MTQSVRPFVQASRSMSAPPLLASLGWFILVVIGSGFLSFVQDVALGRQLPIEIAARAILVGQIGLAALLLRGTVMALPAALTTALAFMGTSMVATLVLSLTSGQDPVTALRSFYFMHGVAIFLIVLPVVPLRASTGIAFRLFAIACCLFGFAQYLAQDLLISNDLRFEYGLIFDRFANGQIRIVSFFNSAPRFAEFLSLLGALVLYRMLAIRRNVLMWLLAYVFILFLVYSTYSRSGYILFVVATLMTVILCWREMTRGWATVAMTLVVIVTTLGLIGVVYLVGSGSEDDIGIFDTASLAARLSHWANLQDGFTTAGFLQLLFGTGEAALYSRSSLDYYVVDNVIFAVLQYGGMLGLAAFIFLFVMVYRAGHAAAEQFSIPALKPVLAFYLGLMLEGQFLDNHNTIFITQLALLAMMRRPSRT